MKYSASELFSVEGRTALVTGASGFLGQTLCETLVANGARVIALGRSERIGELADRVNAAYGDTVVIPRQLDMYDLAAYEALLADLSAHHAIDILVNNAHELGAATGFNSLDGRLEVASSEQWLRNLTGGVLWAALSMKHLGPHMMIRQQGSIINVASMYAKVAPSPQLYEQTGFHNPPGYSAAKAGLCAATRYAASYWGAFGVRVNAILPGPFSNPDADAQNGVAPDDPFVARLRARTVLGRLGGPHELAGALLFLSSDASSFVTGHELVVDGGWTIT